MHGCRVPRDQFFQFGWRPRAPSLLSKEHEAEIAKHLKDYSKRYDEIDSKLLQEVRCCLPTRSGSITVIPISWTMQGQGSSGLPSSRLQQDRRLTSSTPARKAVPQLCL